VIALAAAVTVSSAQAQLQFPLPGLGGALQSLLKKSTSNAANFAGELAGSVSNPTSAQIAAVTQFSNFVALLPTVDLGNPAAVSAASKLGARAGQCLVLQLGTPTATKVVQSLERGMTGTQIKAYETVSRHISSASNSLSSLKPCDAN